IFGIDGDSDEVEAMDSSLNCPHDSVPFVYLGLSIASFNGYGIWCEIIKAISNIECIDDSFKTCFTLKVLNGLSTSFLNNAWWHDGSRRMDAFPRLFALDSFQVRLEMDMVCSMTVGMEIKVSEFL
nr:hypothetical protein [Tanacetum cinerariifolium]